MFPKKTKFFTGLYCIALSGSLFAQEPDAVETADSDDGPLDLSQFPGMLVDDVVVPVPSEIFSIMGKLGEESFGDEIVSRGNLSSRNRSHLALAFGVAVADGFIAVQAQDKEAIEEAGRVALKLSETLGLRDRVLKHTQKIINASDGGDWDGVRKELDRTQQTVRDTMEEMRDGDLANCVSIGGWIRGTEAMSSLISNTYKPDQAELLNQPELAKHFSVLIGKMGADARAVEQVGAAGACLNTIGGLMGDEGKPIDRESIDGIHEASKGFTDAVFAAEPEEGVQP
ncbi:MAG: hypothetical protein ACR2RV_24565 [Verrucomicrobiales bacterium]